MIILTGTLCEAALALAREDFFVFPCVPDGTYTAKGEPSKAPAGEVVPNGFKQATRDEATIRAWWAVNPNYNIGCVPGLSGHMVVDIDVGEGKVGAETLAALEAKHGPLPVSREARSRSGGRHIWLLNATASSNSAVGENIDIKSEGGYVLMPPSRIGGIPEIGLEGQLYTWATDRRAEIRQAPEWLLKPREKRTPLKAAGVGDDKPENIEAARDEMALYVKNPKNVSKEGVDGDYKLYQAVCKLEDWPLSDETIYQILAEVYNPACLPSWGLSDPADEEKFRAKIVSAKQSRQNERGCKTEEPGEVTFAHVKPAEMKSMFVWHDPYEDSFLPPIAYRTANKLWMESSGKTVTQIIGGAKCHKTNFICYELMALAVAGKARVMVMPLEGEYGMRVMRLPTLAKQFNVCLKELRTKFRNIGKGKGQQAFDITNADMVEDLILNLIRFEATDVVIDTQHRAAGMLDENSASDARILWNAVDRIRTEANVDVHLLHHEGKDGSKGGRGSSADLGAVDQQIRVTKDEETDQVTAKVTARKDGEDGFEVRYRIVKGAGTLTLEPFTDTELSQARQQAETNNPYSKTSIASALRGLNAFGVEGVTTHILAAQLRKNGSPAVLKKTAKELDTLAATKLRGYVMDGLWAMPTGQ